MINKKKEYKNLVYSAEVELNLELDNIKNGNINLTSETKKFGFLKERKEQMDTEKINIRKMVDVVDESRGVYMVTIDASQNDQNVRLQGYEQWRKDDVIISN